MKKKKNWHPLFGFILILCFILDSVPTITLHATAWNCNEATNQLHIRFYENEKPNYRFYLNAGERYILETVKEPAMGSTYGEWSVLDLLRGTYTGLDYIQKIPEDYFLNYQQRLEGHIKELNGVLDRSKSTEWSRVMLTLSAMGKDVTKVADTYNFIEKLSKSYKFSYKQGINGPIWEIIAMQTGKYSFYSSVEGANPNDLNSYGKMIDYIINKQITQSDGTQGGFALMGNVPDVDITGMALQALAPFYLDAEKFAQTGATKSYEELCLATEKSVLLLSNLQEKNGGYQSCNSINSEAIAQVIVALTALQIDPLSEDIYLPHLQTHCNFFTAGGERDGVWSNNLIDALLSFYAANSGSSGAVGGFKHVTAGDDGGGNAGTTANAMATDQAVYALIAYDRFLNHQTSLYDMTDQIDGSYKNRCISQYTITFVEGENSRYKQSYAPYEEVEIGVAKGPQKDSFIGWNTKKDGTGVSYLPKEILSMPEKNITLYAQYGSQEFTIHWNMGGGTYTGNDTLLGKYTNVTEWNLPTAEQMQLEGCVFEGWYTNQAFTGNKVTKIEEGTYGEQYFYAKFIVDWTPITEFYQCMNQLDLENLSKEDMAEISKARLLYNNMALIQKEQILQSSYEKLQAAEEEMQRLLTQIGETMQPVATIIVTEKPINYTEVPQNSSMPIETMRNCTEEPAPIETIGCTTQKTSMTETPSSATQEPTATIHHSVEIETPTPTGTGSATTENTSFEIPTTSNTPLVSSGNNTNVVVEANTNMETVMSTSTDNSKNEVIQNNNGNVAEPIVSNTTSPATETIITMKKPSVSICYQKKKQRVRIKVKKQKESYRYELQIAQDNKMTKKIRLVRIKAGVTYLTHWAKQLGSYMRVRAYTVTETGKKIYSAYTQKVRLRFK
ncbi:MAG: InlB B-repeat-containing protein [Lachnospiraceae bacterium]|nr:InlB B-repeat-containing protein [Lachnospiraceae bacterium]